VPRTSSLEVLRTTIALRSRTGFLAVGDPLNLAALVRGRLSNERPVRVPHPHPVLDARAIRRAAVSSIIWCPSVSSHQVDAVQVFILAR
jgi:hypothetical protein